MGGTIACLVELPLRLVDPVHDHRDLHPVGGPVGVREAVLHPMDRLPHAHVEGGKDRVDVSTQGQVNGERRPHGGVRDAAGVEPLERLGDPAADECPAVVHRSLGSARLVLGPASKAMLVLVVGVSVDLGQLGQVVRRPALQVVVPDAHEERGRTQVLHVRGGGELDVVDERLLVPGERNGRGARDVEAHRPEGLRRQVLVTPRGEHARDRVGIRRAGSEHDPEQDGREDPGHAGFPCGGTSSSPHRLHWVAVSIPTFPQCGHARRSGGGPRARSSTRTPQDERRPSRAGAASADVWPASRATSRSTASIASGIPLVNFMALLRVPDRGWTRAGVLHGPCPSSG